MAGWEAEVAENLAQARQMLVKGRQGRRVALCAVECGRCGAEVLAAKFSPQHTSVQWTDGGGAGLRGVHGRCGGTGPDVRARGQGCGSLRDSIDAAVKAGRLEVSPP